MTLSIVKIAPKQRSIHEKFLGIVGELSLIRKNKCQSLSLSSDTKRRTVYHQTPSVTQSIIKTPSIAQSILRHQPAHTDNPQHTQIEFRKPSDPNK